MFFKKIDANYKIRFQSNINYLNEDNDRNIFEDYCQFLSSYDFSGNDIQIIVNFWNETFVPITNMKMPELIKNINHKNNSGNNFVIVEHFRIMKY